MHRNTLLFLCVALLGCALLTGGVIGLFLVFRNGNRTAVVHGTSTIYRSPVYYKPTPAAAPPAKDPFLKLDNNRRLLEERATRLGGPLTWSEFAASPHTHAGRRVMLRQADFDDGTVLVNAPAVLVLMEDVSFNPRRAFDWRPTSELTAAEPGFLLGFFAALAVASEDVVIDLNGFELSQHNEHRMQQRFYANVGLGNSPFINGTGPAAFGTKFRASRGTCIMNGRLGQSSHHGIHGNNADGLMLYNVSFDQYEVASFHCNACKNVVVKDVVALGNNHAIPIKGSYSQARILMPFLRSAVHANPLDTVLADAVDSLDMIMTQAFHDVMTTSAIQPQHMDAFRVFHNPTGLLDGNCYGMAVHGTGPAVDAFSDEDQMGAATASLDIWFENVTIMQTHVAVQEVVVLRDANKRIVRGPAGDVLDILDVIDEQGNFVANPLANAKIQLGRVTRHPLGTLNVPPEIREWATGLRSLASLIEDLGYQYLRNGDSMMHVNKGAVGLRIDGSRGVHIKDVVIRDIRNFGQPGHYEALPGEPGEFVFYEGALDGGHPGQGAQRGYMGADVRGLSIAGASHVTIERLVVENIQSEHGWAHGIDVFNAAHNVRISNTTVASVKSNHVARHGLRPTHAFGLRITMDTEDVTYGELNVTDVKCPTIGSVADIHTSDEEPYTHIEHVKNVFEL